MRRIIILLTACLWLAVLPARAAHTQATLIVSANTAKPGDTIWAGVDLKMEPGWHTYWKNPGDAGMATKIEWQLPSGISAGETQWPLPKKLPPIEVTTYGYDDEVMLLVPLKIETNFPAGQIDLKANVSWLECKEVCIPAKQTVETKLNIGSETKNTTAAVTIEKWKNKVPALLSSRDNWSAHAWWEKQTNGDTRPLIIECFPIVTDQRIIIDTADFFPDASETYEVQAATDNLLGKTSGFRLRKLVKKYSGDWPNQISGVVVMESGGKRTAFEVKLSIGAPSSDGETVFAQKPQENRTGIAPVSNFSENNSSGNPKIDVTPALSLMLLYSFIGGLILNIMPCVLPVIALKILGFVSEAKSSPRRVRALGGIYAVGVLFSFLVLAGIVIGVKAAGNQAGWGMQFGSPIFIVCLTTLVTLVALNLFGVFEVTVGGRALDAAGNLATKHGAAGAFFNGLLATILATPCTAPFLGGALGFAFSQNAATIIFIFLTIGLGLAAPYVLLSCNPALLKFLPKPGAWMEKFKMAMGFPMLVTVVWLFNVAASDFGTRVFWLGAFLVIVAFAAWIFGEFFQRGRKRKGIALAIVLFLLVGGYAYALENKLHWREMISETDATSSINSSDEINWQKWSPQAVAAARADGKIVLVDFTASWCVTCNAIVKPALENKSVSDALKDLNVVTLLADYTRTPQEMTDEISKYGGAGVPLVLVYPKNPGLPPTVLPQPSPFQLPSGYGKIILDALNRAAH